MIGIDSAEVLRKAVAAGAIDRPGPDITHVRDAGLVILATPLEAIVEIFGQTQPHLSVDAIVTDVGSVKAPIISDIEARAYSHVRYVGGHPMFGTAARGIGAASAELVKGAAFVLTPTQKTDRNSVGRLTSVFSQLEMKVVEMSPEEHDRVVARLSHLPYLIGVSLDTIADRTDVAGPSFRGATRVAGSPVELWATILRMNRRAVDQAMREFVAEIQRISSLRGIDLTSALFAARQRHFEKKGEKE